MIRNTLKIGSALAMALSVLLLAAQADAQGTTVPPPVRPALDSNGVNLATDQILLSATDIVIGQLGAGGLSYTRLFYNYSWHSEYDGLVSFPQDDGTTSTYTVMIGSSAETFTKADSPSTSPYVTTQGSASTLTENSAGYTYTMGDGTVAFFSKSLTMAQPSGLWGKALITTLTLPNGEIRTYNYVTATMCVDSACDQSGPWTRLQSVTNNLGYQIKLLYQYDASGSGPVPYTSWPAWTTLAGAMGVNMAVDYCDPLAGGCSGTTQPWPTVTYAFSSGNPTNLTVTDKIGNVTTYTQPGSSPNSYIEIQTPGNATPNIIYEMAGSTTAVLQVTRNGQTWGYSTTSSGGNTTTIVTDPLTRTSTYTFDATSALTSYTNTANEPTTYQNDMYGRPTTVTLATGGIFTYKYDARGNIYEAHHTGSPDLVWQANYDATCTQPNKCNKPNYTIDPAGNETDYTYDPGSGMVASVTLPAPTAGAVRPQTTYTYMQNVAWYKNSSGNIGIGSGPVSLLSSTATCRQTSGCSSTSPDQLRTDITYGSSGVANNLLPTTSTQRDGAGTLIAGTTFEYDVFGNLTAVDGPLGSTLQRTAMEYDQLRRLIRTVGPDPDGSGPRHNIGVRTTYDARGFPTTVDTGTLTGQANSDWQNFAPLQTLARQFDAEGRVTQASLVAQGATSSVQQTTYDALGHVQCQATRMNPSVFGGLPTSACTAGSTGSFGPDRIVQYNYDTAYRLQSVSSSGMAKQTRAYYPGGRLHTLADGNGYLTTYDYDAYGRLSQIQYPDPASPGTSSSSDYEQLGYDLDSNVTSVRRRSGDLIQTPRDALGRMMEKILPSPYASESVYYSYDNQGRILSALYGNVAGNGISQTFDGLGRLSTRTVFGRQLSYGYDLASRRTQLTYPDGYYVTYGYTNVDELQTITDSTGATLASYGYDALGFREQLNRPNGANTGYTPNAIEQLQQLTQSFASGSSSFNMTAQFSYNPAGQIVSKTQSNDAAYTWLPSPANQTISSPADNQNKLAAFQSASVASDGNGDVESGINALTYLYDPLGQLRSARSTNGSVTVDYDPTGMLRRETNGGTVTEYLYDGPDLIAEYVNGALAQRFVHGIAADEPLVWFQGSGTSSPSFLHADERGSIIAASNGSGVVTASVKYGSYGESGALVSPFGYTGQLYMPDLQLYYYKARMYSPQTGRFLQPDPSGYQDNTNLYAYVDGDPLNLGDTSGLGISCTPDWMYSDLGIYDQDGNKLHGGTPVPYVAGLNCQSTPDGGGLGPGNYGSAPQQIPCAAGVSCYLPPQTPQRKDPCSSGNPILDWLYKNVGIDAGVDAGNGLGASGSVDANLREVGADGSLGGPIYGYEGHVGLNVAFFGPGVSNGSYRAYEVCNGDGLGVCVQFAFQNGRMSGSATFGAVDGASVKGAQAYHTTLLGPAPLPGKPKSCAKPD